MQHLGASALQSSPEVSISEGAQQLSIFAHYQQAAQGLA